MLSWTAFWSAANQYGICTLEYLKPSNLGSWLDDIELFNTEYHKVRRYVDKSYPLVMSSESVAELQEILHNKLRYPSPVRAVGSNHSTTHCATTDDATLVGMKNFKRILDIGDDSSP